jgi:Alpha-mannosidase
MAAKETRPDATRICLYVHTHWDREWYWAFERYRNLLISATKSIVADLENGSLPSFHLDGQSCVIEDLLSVEPELEPRIKRLVKDRRLSVGPWYVLPDQMLVGGESLVRNLEVGIKVSLRLGEPMMVGYCPDTFGHTQDLPRILRGFGIGTAVVWRGVPGLDHGPEFFWKSTDGSQVAALLLADGYYQTAFHEVWGESGKAQVELLSNYLTKWVDISAERKGTADGVDRVDKFGYRTFSRLTNSALVPVGGDHINPPQNFGKVLAAVQKSFRDSTKTDGKNNGTAVKVVPVLLEDYLKEIAGAVSKEATPVRLIEGELRDNSAALKHCRGYMLPGVLSTRLYLKRENRLTEHRIVKSSEPLYALMAARGIARYPQHELENAWKQLLLNHPHDSICGCSVDEVHQEMMTRTSSIHQVLDILDRRVREEVLVPGAHEWSATPKAKSGTEVNRGFGRWNMDVPDPDIPLRGHLVANMSAQTVSAPVFVRIASPVGTPASKEEASRSPTASGSSTAAASGSPTASASGSSDTARGAHDLATGANEDAADNLFELLGSDFQMVSRTRETEVFGSMGGVPMYHEVNITAGWLWAPYVPPFGTRLIDLKEPASKKQDSRYQPVAVGGDAISNDYFIVEVSQSGEISVQPQVAGGDYRKYNLIHKFADVADAGDTYNFDPIPGDAPITARFKRVERGAGGPLVGSLQLIYEIDLPEAIEPRDPGAAEVGESNDFIEFKRSQKTRKHEIVTELTLKCGVPVVLFQTSWDNQATDHRLEVIFDTGSPVETSWSENHFSLVQRDAEKASVPSAPVERGTESPLDRFPCQRFFIANGQAFLNKGLPEYATDGSTVSITLLRAVSKLSRGRLLTRGGGAGPHMPTPEANCPGRNIVEYGWAPLNIFAPNAVASAAPARGASVEERNRDKKEHPAGKVLGSRLSDMERSAAYRLAELYEGTLWSAPVAQGDSSSLAKTLDESHSLFDIEGSAVNFSALYSNDGGKSLLLRLLNVTNQQQLANITIGVDHKKVEIVDLAGNTLERLKPVDERYKVPFGVQELVTLRVRL